MSSLATSFVLAASLAAPVAPAPAPAAQPAAPAAAPAPASDASPAVAATPAAAESTPAPAVSVAPAEPGPAPAPASSATSNPAVVSAPATSLTAGEPLPPDPYTARLLEIEQDPELRDRYRRAEGLVIGGGVTLGLGGLALLAIALPARQKYRDSWQEAEDAQWVADREEPAEQARSRRSLMLGATAAGSSLVLAGTVMMAVGLGRRARLRRPHAATLSVAPVVGGGQLGAGATVRF